MLRFFLNLVEKINDINRYSIVNRDSKIVRREKTSVLNLQTLNCGLEFGKNVFVDSDKFLCSREKYRTRQIFMWCNVNIYHTIENNWLKYLLIIFTLKILSFKIQLWEMKVFRICNWNASFTNLFYDTHADNLIVGRNFMTRLFEKNEFL